MIISIIGVIRRRNFIFFFLKLKGYQYCTVHCFFTDNNRVGVIHLKLLTFVYSVKNDFEMISYHSVTFEKDPTFNCK